jgi:hypothetical protein
MTFIVKTQDVDGSFSRRYKTREGALKRYEEMLGRSIETSIAERYFDKPDHGVTRENVSSMRDVSDYGTVVIFEVRS